MTTDNPPQVPLALHDKLRDLLHELFLSYCGTVDTAFVQNVTTELLDCAVPMLRLLDFWQTPDLQQRLYSQLKIILDDHDILNTQRVGEVTERIMALLRDEHGLISPTNQDVPPVPPVVKPADLVRALPLKHIGNVNIVGDCFCFGLAVEYMPETYRAYPIYLNLAGAATSVEGAWARLAQGKETTVVPLERNSSTIYLNPPDKGLYVRVQRKIDGLGMDSLILLHRQLAEPTFTDADLAFLIALNYEQACLRLVDYVSKTVKIAVFPAWGSYLRQQGYTKRLVTPRISYEGIEFWTVKLDATGWTDLICEGLRQGTLRLP
ncbi:MAG: hypothetical protein IT324_06880 [Anaerolineae bacterium]|nr:hypothetical protein [Anaerolineae bacterium]